MRSRPTLGGAVAAFLLAVGGPWLGCFSSKELVAAAPDADVDASVGEDGAPEASTACEPLPPRIDAPGGPLPADGRPSSAFVIDEAADTALDTATGLEWQRAPNAPLVYDEAFCLCERLVLGGKDDWRLASRYELVGILDYAKDVPPVDGPAVDAAVFHDVHPAYYWTSTLYDASDPANPLLPVVVGIGDGRTGGAAQTGGARDGFWCVRGAIPEPPAKRFVASPETVKDVVTGYVWQRSVDPRKWPQNLEPEIETYCAGLTLDGLSSFRLPTVKELQTLVIAGKASPSIDTTAFPATPSKLFHTSSRYIGKLTTNWRVSFGDGSAYPNTALDPKAVRCVKTP